MLLPFCFRSWSVADGLLPLGFFCGCCEEPTVGLLCLPVVPTWLPLLLLPGLLLLLLLELFATLGRRVVVDVFGVAVVFLVVAVTVVVGVVNTVVAGVVNTVVAGVVTTVVGAVAAGVVGWVAGVGVLVLALVIASSMSSSSSLSVFPASFCLLLVVVTAGGLTVVVVKGNLLVDGLLPAFCCLFVLSSVEEPSFESFFPFRLSFILLLFLLLFSESSFSSSSSSLSEEAPFRLSDDCCLPLFGEVAWLALALSVDGPLLSTRLFVALLPPPTAGATG